MKPGLKIETTAGTIAGMTHKQFVALQELCDEGSFDHMDGPIRVVGTDPLGVDLPTIFIGIEIDGYTHS